MEENKEKEVLKETEKVEAPAEEKAKEEAKAPKIVFAYVVTRFENGLSNIEGLPLEEGGTPSIDQYNAAMDVIRLGEKLDRQMILEEAEARVMRRLSEYAQQELNNEAEDPTKA